MDIDEKVGGIELAVGQHHDSSLLAEYGLGPTNEGFIPRERLPEDSWGRADFEMGDVLIFDKFLPHCGLANAANRLRLSIDYRVQPASAPPPILGIVTDIDRDEITIRDGESQFIARATHRSVLRRSALFPSTERLDEYLGRRVIAVVDDSGELVLIRYQRGARWVSASGEGAGARARLG
jgi:hypothetical protein